MSKQVDLVSIVMPCFNASENIGSSINSVINQTYKDWELIIVDDGSTDNSFEIIQDIAMKDSRVKVHRLEQNSGVAAARNFAFSVSKGRYLAFLDSDDLWEEQKLEIQMKFMKNNPHAYFLTSSYKIFEDDENNIIGYYNTLELITFRDMLKGSRIGCLTVLIDTSVTGAVKMEDHGHEDYIMWVSLIKRYGPAHGISESLGRYRVSSTSLSGNKLKSAHWQYRIYKDILNLNIFLRIYYFINYSIRGVFKYRR